MSKELSTDKLKAENIEYLMALSQNARFLALLKDIERLDVFSEKVQTRWAPEAPISNDERIYNDGLQTGVQQVLSFFRGM